MPMLEEYMQTIGYSREQMDMIEASLPLKSYTESTLLYCLKNLVNYLRRNTFDNEDIIGFTRLGDDEHFKSGVAVIFSDKYDGSKRMYVGKRFAGKWFIDCLGYIGDEVVIDEDGFGDFKVIGGSVSVYVMV